MKTLATYALLSVFFLFVGIIWLTDEYMNNYKLMFYK